MNKQSIALSITLMTLTALSTALATENRIRLEKTEIVGSQELPRVVTIMSWKRTETIDLPIMHGQLSQKLKPIERNEFEREMGFRREIVEN